MRKSDSSHELRSADAQITSGFGGQLTSPYADRMTPRSHLIGHDPTPALRQLSAYARPHALGWLDLWFESIIGVVDFNAVLAFYFAAKIVVKC